MSFTGLPAGINSSRIFKRDFRWPQTCEQWSLIQSCLIWQLSVCFGGGGGCIFWVVYVCSCVFTQIQVNKKGRRTLECGPVHYPILCHLAPISIHYSIIHLVTPDRISPYPSSTAERRLGEIITVCQPFFCDRPEQGLFIFYLLFPRESWRDWHSSQLLTVVLCTDFVMESLLRVSYSAKALLDSQKDEGVASSQRLFISKHRHFLVSKMFPSWEVLHCWIIVENISVLPHLNTKIILICSSNMFCFLYIHFFLFDCCLFWTERLVTTWVAWCCSG